MSWTSLKRKAESDLQKITNYFHQKVLTVNFSKTRYVPFTSYQSNLPDFDTLTINTSGSQTIIQGVTNIKYLGIYIDSHMRWDIHMTHLAEKLRYLLYKFKTLITSLKTQHLKVLYNALVQPHLFYGIIGWGGVTNHYLERVQSLQNWILKVIYNKNKLYPTNRLYIETGVFDIRQIFCYVILNRQHRYKSKLVPVSHQYTTRTKAADSMQTRKVDKTLTQRSYYYLGTRIYNKIPPDYKKINSLQLFKSKVKKWLKEKPRDEIHKLIDLKNN